LSIIEEDKNMDKKIFGKLTFSNGVQVKVYDYYNDKKKFHEYDQVASLFSDSLRRDSVHLPEAKRKTTPTIISDNKINDYRFLTQNEKDNIDKYDNPYDSKKYSLGVVRRDDHYAAGSVVSGPPLYNRYHGINANNQLNHNEMNHNDKVNQWLSHPNYHERDVSLEDSYFEIESTVCENEGQLENKYSTQPQAHTFYVPRKLELPSKREQEIKIQPLVNIVDETVINSNIQYESESGASNMNHTIQFDPKPSQVKIKKEDKLIKKSDSKSINQRQWYLKLRDYFLRCCFCVSRTDN
jgi:hypothetical protein